MMKLISQILAAVLGLWLAVLFVPEVGIELLPDSSFFGIGLTSVWQIFLFLGIVLGLLNFFIKPVLDLITLPLRIITLGLFSLAINMAMIWVVDVIFKELSAPLIWPLLWTTFIIWGLSTLLSIFVKEKE
ncbi:MAG: phage holin family protein [Patescibacteria group bacterium]